MVIELDDTRHFIRHPAELPIHYTVNGRDNEQYRILRDISNGGLRFNADNELEPGTSLRITIPFRDTSHEIESRVVWCKQTGVDEYDVGVMFLSQEDRFRTRMVEQICRIEEYRRKQEEKGRVVTSREAAEEWIEDHSAEFPW